MSWNYRVIKFTDQSGYPYWEMREVYYEDDNETPRAYGAPASPMVSDYEGEDLVVNMSAQIERMRSALEKPVLEASEAFGEKERLNAER